MVQDSSERELSREIPSSTTSSGVQETWGESIIKIALPAGSCILAGYFFDKADRAERTGPNARANCYGAAGIALAAYGFHKLEQISGNLRLL